ncbi:MAG: VIT1/CCC1 transporter family protein [Nitrososphaerota archaeon]|jgi:predicted membrane protein (TIGR00267 family)|nr:VIT1/CCC1 transporter family protein [Nitrososphaerota archaeon]MDG6932968.1 VIT1/CCC1 transporter family protein [Nitrososphaerota archaeon]MDG6936303.1 VIT1/CCC1 transporter family protein [Nitrososphaerota archaeon]MDG6944632.1 VIT1/CCC1 transporter family protein [Nitrososphaerota archaeon]
MQVSDFYLDELRDQMLYSELARSVRDEGAKKKLRELSRIEEGHSKFFLSLLKRSGVSVPDAPSRTKVKLEAFLMKLFGLGILMKLFEEREAATVVNYLKLFDEVELNEADRETLKSIVKDEMEHESFFAEKSSMSIVENLRDVLFGMNDGLVELLAAVSGLAGAYERSLLVAITGLVIGIAGALSMSVGAYVSTKSENELNQNRNMRMELSRIVFGDQQGNGEKVSSAKESAAFVGIFYIVGALIPTLPYFLPFSVLTDQFASTLLAVFALAVAGYLTSIISGVSGKRKVAEMVLLALVAALATYLLGNAIRVLTGITAGI